MTRRSASVSMFMVAVLLTALVEFVYLQFKPQAAPSAQQPAPATSAAPGFYPVVRDVDGDTIVVRMNTATETIRLIGVDTPETHKPDTPVQCFGPEAAAFTKQQTEGKTVRLEADPTGDNRDRYNRLLRYVYLEDGTLLDETLITQGYGFAYLSFPFEKKAEFAASEQQARDAKRGVWANCTPSYSSGRWQSNALTP